MTHPPKTGPNALTRRLPILLILLAAVLGFVLLRDKISFAALAENRAALLALRDSHYALTALGFMAAYAMIVGLSLPGATIATLTGGFLFGLFPGVLFNMLGATAGAVLIFLAARYGFGADLAAKIEGRGGAVAKLQAGLRENEWSVLLLMRLMPVVPFFLANLIPAALNVRLSRFAITTFFGIIPGALVITSIGSGLSQVFAAGQTPDLSLIYSPYILGPILGLAGLAALPMVLRALRKDAL